MILTEKIKTFIKDHENDNIHTLILQSGRYPEIDIPLAIRQIEGRQIAKAKFPEWYANDNILYPAHLSLEQSSSEYTARYKAGLVCGESFTDITGGMGIDFYYIAQKFKKNTYVEQQPELAHIANQNFNELRLHNFEAKNQDGIEHLKSMLPVDLLYIDPARRRDDGKKTFRIEDCTPNIIEIEDLIGQKSRKAMIKLSPMLDISLAIKSIVNITDIHIVSHNNECKELLFIKDNVSINVNVNLHCVNINKDKTDIFTFSKEEEDHASVTYTSEPGKYLYEPNASVMKAGAYKSITRLFSIDKLHINSHLYTSDIFHPGFQGRSFIIEQICPFSRNGIKEQLTDIKQANISVRNFPLSAQELKKKLKINDGGDLYIFATTLANEKKVLLLCRKAGK